MKHKTNHLEHVEIAEKSLKSDKKEYVDSKNNKLYSEKSIQKLMKVILLTIPFVYAYDVYTDDRKNNVFAFIALAIAIYYLSKRDFYLPFLGDTVFPGGNLTQQTPLNANVSRSIKVKPYQKVVYWAAEKNKKANPNQMPWTAYKDYSNSGVAVANEKGVAELKVRTPAAYSKPWGWFGSRGLRPHIHFRIQKTSGFWGRVQTVYL